MSILNRCGECNQVLWSLPHTCKPVFLAWLPDDGETLGDAAEVRAALGVLLAGFAIGECMPEKRCRSACSPRPVASVTRNHCVCADEIVR